MLCEGALGLILLVAGDRPQDFLHARNILEFITSRLPVPFLVGVTRQDQPRAWAPADVALYFDLPAVQVAGLNATNADEARDLLAQLLELSLHASAPLPERTLP